MVTPGRGRKEEAPPAYALHRLRRLRDQCRAFRESLPEEHRLAFDELLRDSSDAVTAGAGNIDVAIEVGLSLALHEQLAEVEGRLEALQARAARWQRVKTADGAYDSGRAKLFSPPC